MAITRHAQMKNARVLRSRRVTVTPVDPRFRPGRRSYHRPSTIPGWLTSKQQRHSEPSNGLKEIRADTFPESIAGDIFHEQLSPSVGAGSSFFFRVPLNSL